MNRTVVPDTRALTRGAFTAENTAQRLAALPPEAFHFNASCSTRPPKPPSFALGAGVVDKLKNPPPKPPTRSEEEDAIQLEREIEQVEQMVREASDLLDRLKSLRGRSKGGVHPAAKDMSATTGAYFSAASTFAPKRATQAAPITQEAIKSEMRASGCNAVQAFERLFAARSSAPYSWNP